MLIAQKALSCAHRTGQMFLGSSYLIDVLLGKDNERIRSLGHDRVSTFGIGRELTETKWKSVFCQLVAAGMQKVDTGGKGAFKLSPACRPVLRREMEFELRRDPVHVNKKPKLTIEKGRIDIRKEKDNELPEIYQNKPWEELRLLRLEIARSQSVPPYVIFHDKTLKELATIIPDSLEEMRTVSGIGERKIELYGKQFLKVIREHRKHQEHC
jgi:ATP-dependent DNA helicase RecQ